MKFLNCHHTILGDPLSCALWNVYFGHLVQNNLKKKYHFTKSDTLFARGMDDFIFVTFEKRKAQEFLEQMHLGFPDYHCEIQASKTATNFIQYAERILNKIV